MTLSAFMMFSAVAAVVAVVLNFFVRRYWVAVLLSAGISSLVNVVHEIIVHDLTVRPSDAFFWLPMLFVMGIMAALPAVTIIGILFYVIRQRERVRHR
jgi:hypothetical protein